MTQNLQLYKSVDFIEKSELRLIIRQKNDSDPDVRTMTTTSADEIRKNIDDILEAFPNLNEESVEQLNQLRNKHSECLAGIPVHLGK